MPGTNMKKLTTFFGQT